MRIKGGGEGGKQKARDGGIKNGENKLVGCTRARRCQKNQRVVFVVGSRKKWTRGRMETGERGRGGIYIEAGGVCGGSGRRQ